MQLTERYFFTVTPPKDFRSAVRGAARLQLPSPERWGEDTDRVAAWDDKTSGYWRLAAALDELVARVHPGEVLPGHDDERLLCRLCYVLALYEEVGRGVSPARSPLFGMADATADEQLALVEDRWVDDLEVLSLAFATSSIAADLRDRAGPVVADPVFAGSQDVGGADGDLLVGDTLVEVKTTIRQVPQELDRWLYQLVGYALLDYDDAHGIQHVAFYSSRVPALLSWPLDELLALCGCPVDRATLRAEFRAAAAA